MMWLGTLDRVAEIVHHLWNQAQEKLSGVVLHCTCKFCSIHCSVRWNKWFLFHWNRGEGWNRLGIHDPSGKSIQHPWLLLQGIYLCMHLETNGQIDLSPGLLLSADGFSKVWWANPSPWDQQATFSKGEGTSEVGAAAFCARSSLILKMAARDISRSAAFRWAPMNSGRG